MGVHHKDSRSGTVSHGSRDRENRLTSETSETLLNINPKDVRRLVKDLLLQDITLAAQTAFLCLQLLDLFELLDEGAVITIGTNIPDLRVRKKIRHLLAAFNLKKKNSSINEGAPPPESNQTYGAEYRAPAGVLNLRTMLETEMRSVCCELNLKWDQLRTGNRTPNLIAPEDSTAPISPPDQWEDGEVSLFELHKRSLNSSDTGRKTISEVQRPKEPWGKSRLEQFRTERNEDDGSKDNEPWCRFDREEVFQKSTTKSTRFNKQREMLDQLPEFVRFETKEKHYL